MLPQSISQSTCHPKNLRVKFKAVSANDRREENLPTRPPHEDKNNDIPYGTPRKEL